MLFELLMSPSPAAVVNPPTGFTATTITSTRIDLAWTNASGGLEIEVWRNGSLLDTLAAGTTAYSDIAISAGLEYSYKLRHKSGSNFSVFTTTITRSGSPPAPVQGTPSVVDNDVTISWSQPATTQTAVRVYRDGVNVSGDLSAGATSYVDNDLANATYAYTVRNYNGVAESADSNSENAVVNYNPPLTPPSGFTATSTHPDRVALAWTNGDGTADTEVYRSPTGTGSWTLIATKGPGVAAHNDDDRLMATIYFYRIRHVKGGSISSYVTDNETTITSSFSGVNLAASTSTEQVTLAWTLNNPPVTQHNDTGTWSDTGGFQTAGAQVDVSSGVVIVTYGDIVPKGTGTNVTGTLTYLRAYNSARTELLAELTNLTANFDVTGEA